MPLKAKRKQQFNLAYILGDRQNYFKFNFAGSDPTPLKLGPVNVELNPTPQNEQLADLTNVAIVEKGTPLKNCYI